MSNRSCGIVLVSLSFSATLVWDRDARAGISAGGYTNSATVGDGIVFDELNVNPNTRRTNDKPAITGATISDPIRGQIPVQLHVTNDRLSATDSTTGTIIYQGKNLLGLTIGIAMCDGREYELYLNDIQEALPDALLPPALLTPSPFSRFWVAPLDRPEAYDFMVKKTSQQKPMLPACTSSAPQTVGNIESSPPLLDSPLPPPGAPFKEHLCKGPFQSTDDLWIGYDFALAFEGDYFDPKKRDHRMPSPNLSGWFNLACAGTAAAKMHLLRHTEASSGSATTQDQRTAMLKAITADYCDDGGLGNATVAPRVWTADGTPLFWTDEQGWFPDTATRTFGLTMALGIAPWFPPHWQVEAIWGPKGAICLNDPRRKPSPTAKCPDPKKVPAVEQSDVLDYCKQVGHPKPLPCTSSDVALFLSGKQGHVMTVRKTDQPADYCRN